MHTLKRDILIGLAICAMAVTFALAWGSPFVSADSERVQDLTQQQQEPQQQPDRTKSATFTGTIVKLGAQFALRDTSGQMFKLDDSDRAKPFEGKSVKVTGQLDQQAMVIHVESIETTEV
jgi:hypothetical protein